MTDSGIAMATARLGGVLRRLRNAMAAEGLASLADWELLDRFLMHQDDAAYTALLARHGPMVLRVCERVLRDEHDAEDAFQATFLVLARQSRTIRKRSSLASWLHGVAHRVALDARARGLRRRRHEEFARRNDTSPAADDTTRWSELCALLDEELQRLPDRLRAPLVLCYLEGCTQDEAASQLGVSKSTIRRCLDRGRDELASRLKKRSVTLSAVLLAPLLAEGTASAALPLPLLHATVEAASHLAFGKTMAAAVSARVSNLTEGVLKNMFLKKLKMNACIAALTIGFVLTLAGYAVLSDLQEAKAQPHSAPTLNQTTEMLTERQKKFKSLYVEYSTTDKAEFDFKRLYSWYIPLREGRNREEKVGFSGTKRYFAMTSQLGSIPVDAEEIIPDPRAPEVARKLIVMLQTQARSQGNIVLLNSEIVFDGQTLWSRPNSNAPFKRPAPPQFGASLESAPVFLNSQYLEAIGLRAPSPRGEDEDISHWLPNSLKEFKSCRVLDQTEMVDGKPCVVVVAERSVVDGETHISWHHGSKRDEVEKWWFDPQLGWAPRKREHSANGLLVERWECSQFEEAAPGCWLPKEVRWIQGTPAWTSKEFQNRPAVTSTIKLSMFQVNGGDRLEKLLKISLTDPLNGIGTRKEDD